MKQLDRKSVWIFFARYLFTWFFVFLWLGFFCFSVLTRNEEKTVVLWSIVYEIITYIVVVLLVSAVLSYLFAVLSYRFYRYELREDCFRKESGIIWKRYVSIPYEKIQNVDINRGILARLLGLSDLFIQTAGASAVYGRGGAGAGFSAEGVLPGLAREDAEAMRDELVKRTRGARNQGL